MLAAQADVHARHGWGHGGNQQQRGAAGRCGRAAPAQGDGAGPRAECPAQERGGRASGARPRAPGVAGPRAQSVAGPCAAAAPCGRRRGSARRSARPPTRGAGDACRGAACAQDAHGPPEEARRRRGGAEERRGGFELGTPTGPRRARRRPPTRSGPATAASTRSRAAYSRPSPPARRRSARCGRRGRLVGCGCGGGVRRSGRKATRRCGTCGRRPRRRSGARSLAEPRTGPRRSARLIERRPPPPPLLRLT